MDIKIAKETQLLPIELVGKKISIEASHLETYGKYKAKIDYESLSDHESGKLILVTAINPTPPGEGKTTVNVGLSMAINSLGKTSISALREPSMGPCFGMKGGAAGGGYAQVLPMEDINLHFTGDFHAITSAHNLLAAMIDNHLYYGNQLNLDPNRIVWKRVLDVNDRALRSIEIGLDGLKRSIPRDSGFDITVTSEIMAVICLSQGIKEVRERLDSMLIGYTMDGQEVTCQMMGATGSMMLLLKDALKPNLVQTVENTPAILHGGPFANIAHGCNSIIATQTAMKLCQYTVTEAGFGSDLGAEKFLNIKCREANISPDAIVLVATIRALKYNGLQELSEIEHEDLDALTLGLSNLDRHFVNLKQYGVPIVVALNSFPTDTSAEEAVLYDWAKENQVVLKKTTAHAEGSKGSVDLAVAVMEACETPSSLSYLYEKEDTLMNKITRIAQKMYGAKDVTFTDKALEQVEAFQKEYGHYYICMAKTQVSFTDDPKRLGAPKDFTITIRELRLSKGAQFVVAYTGNIVTMPGLPKVPAALAIDYTNEGEIIGLK